MSARPAMTPDDERNWHEPLYLRMRRRHLGSKQFINDHYYAPGRNCLAQWRRVAATLGEWPSDSMATYTAAGGGQNSATKPVIATAVGVPIPAGQQLVAHRSTNNHRLREPGLGSPQRRRNPHSRIRHRKGLIDRQARHHRVEFGNDQPRRSRPGTTPQIPTTSIGRPA